MAALKENATKTWADERTARLEQHKAQTDTCFERLKRNYLEQRADLKRSRAVREVEIETDFTTKHTERVSDVETQVRSAQHARDHSEVELKRKREDEDLQIIDNVLSTFDATAFPKPNKTSPSLLMVNSRRAVSACFLARETFKLSNGITTNPLFIGFRCAGKWRTRA